MYKCNETWRHGSVIQQRTAYRIPHLRLAHDTVVILRFLPGLCSCNNIQSGSTALWRTDLCAHLTSTKVVQIYLIITVRVLAIPVEIVASLFFGGLINWALLLKIINALLLIACCDPQCLSLSPCRDSWAWLWDYAQIELIIHNVCEV